MSTEPLVYELDGKRSARWIILDRDGTLNRDRGYTYDPLHLELLPGVAQTLRDLSGSSWGLLIATNQAGVAKGKFTLREMETFNASLIGALADCGASFAGIAVCPHHPDSTSEIWGQSCDCRKPKPGLISALQSRFQFDSSSAVFVGNRETDMEAASCAGIPFHWGRNEGDWARISALLLRSA